jgi:hypothetical protein
VSGLEADNVLGSCCRATCSSMGSR